MLLGDKSISHRVLFCAALFNTEPTVVKNLPNSDDIKETISVIEILGATFENEIVHPCGNFSHEKCYKFELLKSGTTLRLLLGIIVGLRINAQIILGPQLSARPHDRVIHPLCQMGANIEQRGNAIFIKASDDLVGYFDELKVPSAQVKSSIMFACELAGLDYAISDKFKVRDHTDIMFKHLPFSEYIIPNDPSSAAFIAAYAILTGGIAIKNVLVNPTRLGWLKALCAAGAEIELINSKVYMGELVADIVVKKSNLKPFLTESADAAMMIDEFPILCALAAIIDGVSVFQGVDELRYKESDRVEAIIHNVKSLGANAEYKNGSLRIYGKSDIIHAEIKTFDDHRIAMAFGVISKAISGEIKLDNPMCINKSYPNFLMN